MRTEREERLLREEMLHRLRREENRLREQLDLERDRRLEAHTAKLRERLREEMEVEVERRKAFLKGEAGTRGITGRGAYAEKGRDGPQGGIEAQVNRKVEAHRLEQEIQMRERTRGARGSTRSFFKSNWKKRSHWRQR